MNEKIFINLTNHPSKMWSKKQIEEANKYGEIIDIPFPNIDPTWGSSEMDAVVDEYYHQVKQYDQPVVMLQGEFVFVFRLATRLKEAGIKVITATTKRSTQEKKLADGTVKKESIFEFVRFREY